MNKSALKRFATSMRLELISLVKTKIDFLLSDAYKENLAKYNMHKSSIEQIADRYSKEKDEFIEEVAYTWFNRLVALRFMDVNEITPSPIISTTQEHPIPKMFSEAKAGNIDEEINLNRELFFDLIDKKVAGIKDSDNEAYKMLFISTCNNYANLMPSMFEKISDYTELLLPDDMLSPNSARAKVVEAMSHEDCQDIEVIGWLYQFYISEKKDEVFAKLAKNQKITLDSEVYGGKLSWKTMDAQPSKLKPQRADEILHRKRGGEHELHQSSNSRGAYIFRPLLWQWAHAYLCV